MEITPIHTSTKSWLQLLTTQSPSYLTKVVSSNCDSSNGTQQVALISQQLRLLL